ncbi:MAG: dienelactone hydrolase family protein [Desulfomonilaceae bacterium]
MTTNLGSPAEDRPVSIAIGSTFLEGDLNIPSEAESIVVFAHGSGSSRHSRRNRFVAKTLRQGGPATLLLDLLTPEEERIDIQTRQFRFDIDLLARRVVAAVDWLVTYPDTHGLEIGCFGSSTGAAAALIAAKERPELVHAVVSRGGRPDLAADILGEVQAPTLFIVGGKDSTVLKLNEKALAALRTEKKLEIIHGATHLFEEPGALDKVAILALQWFVRHLQSARLMASCG